MPYYDDQQKLEDFLKTNSHAEWSPMEFIDEINKLGGQYDLTLDELGLLYEETRKVLAGESPIENLSDNISKGLQMYGSKQLAMDLESLIRQAKKNLGRENVSEVEQIPITTKLEIPPVNLPMVEEGEVAHEVAHIEPTTNTLTPPNPGTVIPPTSTQNIPPTKLEQTKVPLPDYRYEGGKDPYREPLG